MILVNNILQEEVAEMLQKCFAKFDEFKNINAFSIMYYNKAKKRCQVAAAIVANWYLLW